MQLENIVKLQARVIIWSKIVPICGTGNTKSMSEALIFASSNPQYDDRLFIELQVQYMKNPS